MQIRFRIVLSALALGGFFCCSLPGSATVRCTCPSIKAEGVGNSSCSASESNGNCTVDFNAFNEREIRSRELLQSLKALQTGVIPDPNAPATEALFAARNEGPEAVVDALIIYLFVALSGQQPQQFQSEIREIADALHKDPGKFANEFMASKVDDNEMSLDAKAGASITVGPASGRLGPGCIELRTSQFWVMFKLHWSPLRDAPQCGE